MVVAATVRWHAYHADVADLRGLFREHPFYPCSPCAKNYEAHRQQPHSTTARPLMYSTPEYFHPAADTFHRLILPVEPFVVWAR